MILRFYIILLAMLAATVALAQPCPGPSQRTALLNLQRANVEEGTRAGQIPLTDTCGNQRYAQYVEINLTPINYIPTTTGNALNLSEFVVSSVDTGLYYIDWQGNAIKFGAGGGGGTCDVDWLEIGANTCPDNINDSIYTYKYVAIGARYVWPTAEFLVNDSTATAVQVISGSRNARLVFYDNNNVKYSTIDQSGASTLWYLKPGGSEFRILTAAGGSPENPAGPFVNQFGVNPPDSTVQLYRYPNTRIDTQAVLNFLYTDQVGKIRSQSIDSLIVLIIDSIAIDTSLLYNWYTRDDITTDSNRVADVLYSATWRSADGVFNGNVPFRFEIATGLENEPEMMTWKFPGVGDSLLLAKSDFEIYFRSTNKFLLWSDADIVLLGDSVTVTAVESVDSLPYILGQTAIDVLKRFNAADVPPGSVLVSDGAFWRPTTISGDTSLQYNWYNRDETTTDPLRTATILQSAQWIGDDPDGYLLLQMGSLGGGRLLIDTVARMYHSGLGGTNYVSANERGIEITTSNTATRSVSVWADTVNWGSRFEDYIQIHNLLPDYTHFVADSEQVVGIGQFPCFPYPCFDGTDRGFFYDPGIYGVVRLINGSAENSKIGQVSISDRSAQLFGRIIGYQTNISLFENSTTDNSTTAFFLVNSSVSPLGDIQSTIYADSLNAFFSSTTKAKDTITVANMYLGIGAAGTKNSAFELLCDSPRRAWGVQTIDTVGTDKVFDWIQSFLPNDTTENAVSFYNRAYYWKNQMPVGSTGDTIFHYWRSDGVNAGRNPGFMTLSQICASCTSGGGVGTGSSNQMLGMNNAGTGYEWKTIQGTLHQVNVTNGTNLITLSTPQNIHTTASPTFYSQNLTGGQAALNMLGDTSNSLFAQSTGLGLVQFVTNSNGAALQAFDLRASGSSAGANVVVGSNDGANNVTNDRLGGYNLSGYAGFPINLASIEAYAEENYSGSSAATRLSFYTTASGTLVKEEAARFTPGGDFELRFNNAARFYNNNNSFFVGLRSPVTDSLSASYNLILPRTPGTNGQVLKIRGDSLLYFDNEGGGGGVNIYNANGTTTDNTRIADVLETLTFRSDDAIFDGVYPFRFEIASGSVNEPEMMVWKFPTDSATLSQSDQEIIFFTNNFMVIKSDAAVTVQADSFQYNPNLGGTAFKVGQHNVITQNSPTGSPTHKDAVLSQTITGTAQAELFLDGAGGSAVWVIPTNSAQSFKVHISAICSNVGAGVGINLGDAYASWHLGGIKRVGSATSLIGTVQAAATAQSDTGMSTSVVTIDADDTAESLRIRFTPPSTAGTGTVIQVTATIEATQTSY